MEDLKTFSLSDQALGAVMMALQRSLMDQSDIVPVLKGMSFVPTANGLVVKNPPTVKLDAEGMVLFDPQEDNVENINTSSE